MKVLQFPLDKNIWEGSIPWITSGDLHSKIVKTSSTNLNELGVKKYNMTLIPKRSVLIGTAGQGKTRGTVAINENEITTNDAMLAMVHKENVDYRFLYLALYRLYKQIRLLSPKDAKTRLSTSMLTGFKIKVPSMENQEKNCIVFV